MDDAKLQEGLNWGISQTWVDERIRELFRQTAVRMANGKR